MSQPCANCRITMRGSFNLNWADYVGDMLVSRQVEEGNIRTTTLIGHPIDLAAFLGTLHMLIDRGFSVIAFDYQQANEPDIADKSSAADDESGA
ncbi:MAG TPA: hypothetical protein VMP08_03920 [Anaerolineae bacterium]|nr:hypothetical protein [Anaerolineae bacterium]